MLSEKIEYVVGMDSFRFLWLQCKEVNRQADEFLSGKIIPEQWNYVGYS